MLRQILIKTPAFSVINHPKFIVPSCILGIGFDERGVLGVFRKTFDPNLPADSDTLELEFFGIEEEMDPITLWRTMLILQLVNVPEEMDLISAYYAAQRSLEPDEEEMADLVLTKIGRGVHYEIMNTALSNEILEIFFNLISEGKKVNLEVMSEEVEAGNVEWTVSLVDAGVMHPDEIKARKEHEAKIIANYAKELQLFSEIMNISLESLEISNLKEKLVEVIYKGIESLFGRDIAFGIAFVQKETEEALFMAERLKYQGLSKIYLDRITNSAIKLASLVLPELFRRRFIVSWPIRNKEEYVRLLTKINNAYVTGSSLADLVNQG